MRVTEWIPENLRGVIFTKLAYIAQDLPCFERKMLQLKIDFMRHHYDFWDDSYT